MRSVMSFSVICFWLSLAAIWASTSVCGAPVLDTSRNPVREGYPYRIVPANPQSGGGLIPYPQSNAIPCPPDVVQSSTTSNAGSAVYFTALYRAPNIETNERIRIEFTQHVNWSCPQSKIWNVRSSGTPTRTYVNTGGATGEYRFAIHADGDAYKIVHLLDSSGQFRNVGVFTDNYQVKRLILQDVQLRVKFQLSLREPGDFEETMLKAFAFY